MDTHFNFICIINQLKLKVMTTNSTINCPKCDSSININEVISDKIKSSIQSDFLIKEKELKQLQENLEKEKNNQDEIVKRRIKEIEKKMLQDSIKKAEEQYDVKIQSYKEELEKKNESLKEFYKLEAENEKLKREKEVSKMEIKKQLLKDFNSEAQKKEEELRRNLEEDFAIKVRELEKKITEQKKLTEEQKRKLDQGSMQLQGETQEEAIEKWLLKKFPLDNVLEVKKGALGADCLHVINEFDKQNCGTIYYESKNTKSFNEKWIKKFKKDLQSKNADIGVIVTKAYPKNTNRMTVIDGRIYICSYQEFKGLCSILRNVILEFSKHRIVNENIHEKKELLYNFLTSNKFISGIERIIESFVTMNEDLEKEERISIRNFENRRTQLNIARDSTVKIFTSFSSIAGSSIKNLKMLEYDSDPSLSNVELLQEIINREDS